MTHVCFDLDGTLCNSTTLGFESTNAALEANGKAAITLEDYEACTRYDTITRFGVHLNTLNGGSGPTSDPEIMSEALRIGGEFERQYTSLVSPSTAPFFPSALSRLRELNASERLSSSTVTMSILTNAKQEYAVKVLQVNDCSSLFSSVHGADSAGVSKPNPGGLNLIMSENNVTPETTIFVGDSLSDGEAGINSNCRTIGCSWGAGKGLEESGFFTEGVVHSVDELFDKLETLIESKS
ncbi:hypothetical protein TrST_g12253 [Triparma strigata]|uniref:Phosphoglycolate phosphatase n=1 Tax=Triparma strigata TaxID=1606541 RepID=A0A9W7B9P0_9STRA|nr:hypothetical protein TrST_g12253 [Triparma strigata]